MKKSIFPRIFAALGGLTLWAFGALAVAETFFHVPVMAFVGEVLGARTPLSVLISLLAAIVLFVLGLCCLMMLSTKRALKRRGYVMQKSENGVIGVSVKSIEGLVQTCVKQHEMIAKAEIAVVERRDGIVILLNVEEAAGVNIPLAVGALQKQIKQYVNTCTGVDVHEVRVMVDNTEDEATGSLYAVEKPLLTAVPADETQSASDTETAEEAPAQEAASAEVTTAEDEAVAEAPALEEVPEEAPAAEEPAPAMSIPVMPVMPEVPEEEDDRPLHQRIFGTEEQPVFVPAPPELIVETQAEEILEDVVAETVEDTVEEIAEAGEIEANAVLEVVEAIAEEEITSEAEYVAEDGFEADEAPVETAEEEIIAEETAAETEISQEPEDEVQG